MEIWFFFLIFLKHVIKLFCLSVLSIIKKIGISSEYLRILKYILPAMFKHLYHKFIKIQCKKFTEIYLKFEYHFLKELRITSKNTYFFLLKCFLLVFFSFSSSTVQISCLISHHDTWLFTINYLVLKIAITLFFVRKKTKDIVAT